MYLYSVDQAAGCLVSSWFGNACEADYETALEQMLLLDRHAAASGITYVQITEVEAEYPQPSPKWRKRMSEANRGLLAPRYRFVLVSRNRVIRAVVTAVDWLSGTREGHQTTACATFDDAAAWVRTTTGEPHPQLETLHLRVRFAMRSQPIPKQQARTK